MSHQLRSYPAHSVGVSAGTLTGLLLTALLALPVASAITTTIAVPRALAQGTVSVEIFHDELSPFGRWVEHRRHGYVWYPSEVDDNWRPYTHGHWVNAATGV